MKGILNTMSVPSEQKAELSLKKLSLSSFRSYDDFRIESGNRFVLLTGDNGVGKTNILEAISLLSPGRGLRNAKISEIQNIHINDKTWAVSADLLHHDEHHKIGTALDYSLNADHIRKEKRIVRIDGETQSSQTSLSDYLSILWLTPQMEKLFLEGSYERRRFFDRFVFSFDPSHSGRLSRYENALRERSKILKQDRPDPKWLDLLEQNMAESAMAITAARKILCEKLSQAMEELDDVRTVFPAASIRVSGTLEEFLNTHSALECEDYFRQELKYSRNHDAIYGGAKTGPHKSDIDVMHLGKKMPAHQCSTGEQKSLLITLILSQSTLVQEERGAAPILLLDDIVSHLDDHRRGNLFDYLSHLNSQYWITGTDTNAFAPILPHATHHHLRVS